MDYYTPYNKMGPGDFPQDLVAQFALVTPTGDWTKSPYTFLLMVMNRCEEILVKIPILIAEEVEKRLADTEMTIDSIRRHLHEDLNILMHGGPVDQNDDGLLGELRKTFDSYSINLKDIQATLAKLFELSCSMAKQSDAYISAIDQRLVDLKETLGTVHRLEEQILTLEKKYDEQKQRCNLLFATNRERATTISERDGAIVELRSMLTELKVTADLRQEVIGEQKVMINNLKNSVDELHQKLNDLNIEKVNTASSNNKTIKALQSKIDTSLMRRIRRYLSL
jgi:chromosome segregation ATPase